MKGESVNKCCVTSVVWTSTHVQRLTCKKVFIIYIHEDNWYIQSHQASTTVHFSLLPRGELARQDQKNEAQSQGSTDTELQNLEYITDIMSLLRHTVYRIL